jgi:hypothetical protein
MYTEADLEGTCGALCLSINKKESYDFNECTNGETKSIIGKDIILINYQRGELFRMISQIYS